MQEANVHELVRLAPRMAHNVRDEIAFLQSAMQTVIGDESISSDVRDKISTIKMMAGNIAQLAWQLLIISGTQDALRTVIDVRDTVLGITSLIERLLGDNTRLQTSFDEDLWPIQGDAEQIEQILLPLVVNAREAMPRGGTLRIRAHNVTKAECKAELKNADLATDYVVVELADEGTGIPNDIMGRLFEPFGTTKGSGCGFGLAKVHHTVSSLNGLIMCQSEAERGTTFRIFLPRHSYEPEQ
jgi:two-component system cell cycle sensor histidine kinase/response regulator CckA